MCGHAGGSIRPSADLSSLAKKDASVMNGSTSLITSLTLLAVAAVGCESPDTIEQQEADFRLWQQSKKCLVNQSLQPAIKICVHGQGDLDRGREMVMDSLPQWLDAVRPLHPGVTDKIEFTCDDPHGWVRIRSGSGRAFASAGKTTVYNTSKLGTYLHEFGHAFACLGDTYVGSTAGKCQSGQPHSIMCDGFLRTDLSDDDIAGVREQFKRMVGLPDPGDIPELPPTDPNDLDGVGVPNEDDLCAKTPLGSHVWGPGEYFGCAGGQHLDSDPDGPAVDEIENADSDDDGDGVKNDDDRCPTTPEGSWVWEDQHNGKWKGCAPGEVPVW